MPRTTQKKRVRRDAEQLVADLEAKIEAIKARAARRRAKSNPAVRHTVAAVRNIDKALGAATDAVLRKALEDARGELSAYLVLQGIVPAGGSNGVARSGRRTAEDVERMGSTVLDFVAKNPGQRAEQIAESLGIDTKSMRRPMQVLIGEGKVKTKGQRRAMRYYPA